MEIMGIIKGVPLMSILLFILNLLLIFPRDVTSAQLNYVNYACPASENSTYTLNSVFQKNLNSTLFSVLPTNASSASFSAISIGQGIDRVDALYMCRGDIDTETCQDCVKTAATKLVNLCQPQKEGIVWYEECLLRYSNQIISSRRDLTPQALYKNTSSMWSSDRLDRYKDKIDTAMGALINKTAFNLNLKGFDTTEINLSSSQTLQGLAQCTPDILSTPCQTCLKYAYKQQDMWSNTEIFLPSCLIMFDLYGSPPPPVQPGPNNTKIILIVVPIIVAVLLLLGGFYFWKNYCNPRQHQQQSENPSGSSKQGRSCLQFLCHYFFPEPMIGGLRKFSYTEVESMTNGFLRRLGEGGYGYVYYGCLADGSHIKEVAIKVLTKDAPKQFSTEIAVLGKISHKNLVVLIGYCEEPNHLALVFEYMASGDLKFLLSGSDPLSWKKRLQIAIESAQGLDYLHNGCKPAIVHRDVKTANILLTQNLRAKIADFGSSKIFPDEDISVLSTRVIGTAGYLDPQYHISGQLTEKSDVYSFGVVLLELITGKDAIVSQETISGQKTLVQWVRPFLNRGDLENIVDLRLPQVQSRSSLWKATDLAMECLNDTERPAMSQIVAELKECLAMEMDEKSSFAGHPNSMEIMNLQFSTVMDPTAR